MSSEFNMSGNHERLTRALRWPGMIGLPLAAAIAVLILLHDRRLRDADRERTLAREQIRMYAARLDIESYMADIALWLRIIASDAAIVRMSSDSHENLQELYVAHHERHRLAEIYVIERDFDGTHRPFMTFERGDDMHEAHELHSLNREKAEYAVQIEHIRTFEADHSLTTIVSRPIELCVGRPGLVVSTPIRNDGELAGIVAGMVVLDDISAVLKHSTRGNAVVLASSDGTLLGCEEVPDSLAGWFRERLAEQSPDQLFGDMPIPFVAGRYEGMWTRAVLPGQARWYLAFLYNKQALTGRTGPFGMLAAFGSAGLVLLLGIALTFICRLVPLLARARHLAEARSHELTESEARIRAILEAAPDGIVTVDGTTGIIESFNAAAEHMFEYPAAEAVGRSVLALLAKTVSPEGDDSLSILESLIGRGARQLPGQRSSGAHFPLEMTVSLVRLPERQVFTCVFREITARVEAERRARQHLNELAHVARLGTIGEVTASLAHELGQPLAAMANYIHSTRTHVLRGLTRPEDLAAKLEGAATQMARATEIIDRIRGFARKEPPPFAPLHLNTLTRQAIDWVAPEAHRRSIRLEVELASSLPVVHGESIQIEQVILNLIWNALEALSELPHTDGVVTVRTALAASAFVELAVEDNGPGIAEDDVDTIFAPFFTTKPRGLGLGLAISRSIIESHGGRVSAERNPTRGATFRFWLPTAAENGLDGTRTNRVHH